MNYAEFGEFKTGTLTRIKRLSGEEEFAFTPSPLPSRWDMPRHIDSLLGDARDRIFQLDGIGRTLPHPRLLLRPLQRKEAVESSRIEGTVISGRDLLLFELEQPGKETEWREVFNYYSALRAGYDRIEKGAPLSQALWNELHVILLSGTASEEKEPGKIRTVQNYIGRRFVPPPPDEVIACLDNLENYILQGEDYHPLIRAFLVHYQFETIHPYVDGNGRVGRLILALSVFRGLNLSRPWLYLSPYFERNREEYKDRLFRISSKGEWEEWVKFCLIGCVEEAASAVRKCDKFRELRAEYLQKITTASNRTHTIIEELFSLPIVRVRDVQDRFHVTYPTAKSDLEWLVQRGILAVMPGRHPATYFAHELINVAFG